MGEKLDIARQWVMKQWHTWTHPDNRWLSGPCAVAALLVLVVAVKSCQGIAYNLSTEAKLYKLGYPIDEARAMAEVLPADQADSLIARHGHDSIAYPIMQQRYFIASNFDRYLSFHKTDTSGLQLAEIVAIVNVGGDTDRHRTSAPADTSKGVLILVNGRHYLDEHYRPSHLVTIKKSYCYESQQAVDAVVDAFVAMQQECHKQTHTTLLINSAYRSHHEQIATYKRNDKRYVARAGYSEHQTGLAIDVTSLQHPEKWSFGKSKEGIWMRENCHRYGLILRYPERQSHIMGYSYEPWHLRYVGPEVAQRIHDEGITFDEYYAYYIERAVE